MRFAQNAPRYSKTDNPQQALPCPSQYLREELLRQNLFAKKRRT